MELLKAMGRTFALAMTCAGLATSGAAHAQAGQWPTAIDNVWRAKQQITLDGDKALSGPTADNDKGGVWVFEPVGSLPMTYRIKSMKDDTYLNAEDATVVKSTNVPYAYNSSYWVLEPIEGAYRIRNYYRNTYLHAEAMPDADGKSVLALGDAKSVPTGWLSARWKLRGADAIQTPVIQCVKNVWGTGIVARVSWWDQAKVTIVPADPRGDNADTPENESQTRIKTGFAKPLAESVIAVGQDSCTGSLQPFTQPRVAVVSVEGGKFASAAVSVGASTLVALGGIAVCAPTFGAGCAAAAAAVAAIGQGGIGVVGVALPDAKEIFYIGKPGILEVSGTVFNPTSKETKPLN